HADIKALLSALLLEHDLAILEREQGVVGARAHIVTRAHRCAALANDDVPGQDALAAEDFHAQSLGVGIAAVLGTAACLFMCHECSFRLFWAALLAGPHGFPAADISLR